MKAHNGKTEAEALLNVALPFAEEMLAKHGEFFPFGRAMTSDGKIKFVEGFDGRERPPSNDIIELIARAFREAAATGENRATAIIYDVKIVPPGQTTKTDAIAAELEHQDGYTVTVFFPYALKNDGPELGPAFATAAGRGIFGKI